MKPFFLSPATSFLSAVCLFLLTLIACDNKPSPPDHDNTPPQIKLKISLPGEMIIINQNSAPVTRRIESNAEISLEATARDSQSAIRNVMIAGRMKCECGSQEPRSNMSAFRIGSQNPADSEGAEKSEYIRKTLFHFSLAGKGGDSIRESIEPVNCFEGEFYAAAVNAAGDTTKSPIFRLLKLVSRKKRGFRMK